jgi:hypothetical protein
MAVSMQIEVHEEAAEQIRELAATLRRTPEEIAEEVVTNGLHMLLRYAALLKRSATVDIAEGRAILKRAGVGNAPDPGDELPEDLQYLIRERRT